MRCGLIARLLLLCMPLPLQSAEVPDMFRIFSEPVKASSLLGREVRNRGGERVGRVTDLVFDLRNNRVHRVVVGDARYPMHALELSREQTHLVLDDAKAPTQTWDDARLVRASRFVGGTVVDVIIDAFWGNAAFAVMEAGGALRPVPLDGFGIEGGAPVLRIERGRIEALEGFTPR